jgi:RNA polymerase sigma-70 factor (ECF subfamily)
MDGPRAARLVAIGRDSVTDAAADFADRVASQLDRSYRLATVILGSAMEAEDAVADAALAAWRSRGRLREQDRFEAWFARILVNGCRDRLRLRARRPVAEMAVVELAAASADLTDFRDGVHQRDALSRAFETLDADARIVLVLRFWQDLPVDAIADRLAIPSGTVKSRLHHATARLRAALTAGEDRR